MLPELESILRYRNPLVIRKFREDHRVDEARANRLFTELMKFLWASQKHSLEKATRPADPSLDFSFGLHEEMRALDEMWHCFILCTEDYSEFCQGNFGRYLHHRPSVWGARLTEEEFRVELERYLAYLLELFGAETVGGWFGVGGTAPGR